MLKEPSEGRKSRCGQVPNALIRRYPADAFMLYQELEFTVWAVTVLLIRLHGNVKGIVAI